MNSRPDRGARGSRATESHASRVRHDAPLPSTVKLLSWASFLNDVSSEMVYPLLPKFLEVLGATKLHLGVIEGLAEATASLLKLWSGARTDQTGRRRGLVVFGYVLAVITRPMIGLATAIWQVLALRIGDRIGKGVRTSPRDALIADVTDESNRGRAFGFHRGMDHLGAAVGPLLAAAFLWMWPGKLSWLFLLSIVPGIAVVVLILFLRDPTGRSPGSESPKPKSQLTLRPFDRDFRIFLAALLLFTLGNSTDMFLLVRAGESGVPQPLLPLLWCLFHVIKSSGNMLGGRLVDRWGPRPQLVLGWLLYVVVYFLFAFAFEAWHFWILFSAYAIYYALTEPAEKTLVANLVGAQNKGLAFGWFNLIVGVGVLPASVLFGALYQHWGAVAAFGTGASMALVSVLILTQMRVRRAT
jgi:MFS family permease